MTTESPEQGLFSFDRKKAMHDVAVAVITDYIENSVFEPAANWPKHMFELRSRERWAAGEILQRVLDNPMTPATTIIESFMVQMLIFSFKAKDSKEPSIYRIAKETAEEILLLFA